MCFLISGHMMLFLFEVYLWHTGYDIAPANKLFVRHKIVPLHSTLRLGTSKFRITICHTPASGGILRLGPIKIDPLTDIAAFRISINFKLLPLIGRTTLPVVARVMWKIYVQTRGHMEGRAWTTPQGVRWGHPKGDGGIVPGGVLCYYPALNGILIVARCRRKNKGRTEPPRHLFWGGRSWKILGGSCQGGGRV